MYTRMSYGSSLEKHLEAIQICKKNVLRRINYERDQHAKPGDPQIILGIRVMCARLESSTVVI